MLITVDFRPIHVNSIYLPFFFIFFIYSFYTCLWVKAEQTQSSLQLKATAKSSNTNVKWMQSKGNEEREN